MHFLQWFRRILHTDGWIREQAERWATAHFPGPDHGIAAKVAEILVEQVGIGFDSLAPTTRFIEDLGMDDLEPVTVVMALEEEFGFSIPDADTALLATIADLVRYLHERVQAKASHTDSSGKS
jgi:acyl carrier protein